MEATKRKRGRQRRKKEKENRTVLLSLDPSAALVSMRFVATFII
jgi:hypothetical protein